MAEWRRVRRGTFWSGYIGGMTAFEVFVDGEHVCTAGMSSGVLSAILSWVSREEGEAQFSVGGISGIDKTSPHVDWNIPARLKIGAEVRIRIISTDDVDPPDRSHPRQQK